MPEEHAQLYLVSNNEETMPRLKQKDADEHDEVSESGQLTWIYRGVIGFLVTLVVGLVAWEGQSISGSVGQLKTDISSFKSDVTGQIGGLKTDYATTSVVLMGLQNQIGEESGKSIATTDRFNRVGDMVNALRDRLTVLETKYDDHVKTAPH